MLSPKTVLRDAKFKHTVDLFAARISKEYGKYGVDTNDDEKMKADTAIYMPSTGNATFFLLESDSIPKLDTFLIAYVEKGEVHETDDYVVRCT